MYGVHVDIFIDHKGIQYVLIQIDLDLQQRMWLELLKYYGMSVLYKPNKASAVEEALCRLFMGSVYSIKDEMNEIVCNMHRLARLGVELVDSTMDVFLVHNVSVTSFVDDFKV